jgi:hypothetical protein
VRLESVAMRTKTDIIRPTRGFPCPSAKFCLAANLFSPSTGMIEVSGRRDNDCFRSSSISRKLSAALSSSRRSAIRGSGFRCSLIAPNSNKVKLWQFGLLIAAECEGGKASLLQSSELSAAYLQSKNAQGRLEFCQPASATLLRRRYAMTTAPARLINSITP